jgi:surface carbohydrate biosynthesis protein (TIGR04326 family)
MCKEMSLLIWDSNDPPVDGNDFVVLWKGYAVKNSAREVSVLQLVENNASRFKSQYLALIYDLGEGLVGNKRAIDHLKIEEGFSYWWMTLFNEKCNFSKSPEINDIVKLMALKGWLVDQNYCKIELVSKNGALADSIQILTKKLGIEFKWSKLKSQKSLDGPIKRVYKELPHVFKATFFLLYYLMNRWQLKGLGVKEWKSSTATMTFVSYFFNLSKCVTQKGVYKSGYWTKLPDILKKHAVQSNWLHIYVKSDLLPTASTAKKLIKKINRIHQGQQNHLLLDSFLSVTVVKQVVISWLVVACSYLNIKKVVKKQTNYLYPLFKKDLKASLLGVTAIQNLLLYYLFKSAMKSVPRQSKGFYLQENQGWEFGFIHAWKDAKHESGLIGVPHSTVRYWDLRYFFDLRSYKKKDKLSLPLPDYVGVNGQAAKKKYLDGGYPVHNLVEVEALRYLYLDDIFEDKAAVRTNVKNGKTVLVLGDYLKENNIKQMKLLQDAQRLIDQPIEYIMKSHPACQIIVKDYPDLNLTVVGSAIDVLVKQCDIAYTSSFTSAAVDVYCAGKPVVTILDDSGLNMSPLRGYKDVSFLSTAQELANVFNNIGQMENIENQGGGYFYLDDNLPRWKMLLFNKEVVKI